MISALIPWVIGLAVVADGPAPAPVETGPWVAVAGGSESKAGQSYGAFSIGAGVDRTVGLASFGRGFGDGGPFHFRLGPWLALETPFDRVRGEGGVSFSLGQVRYAPFGTVGGRLGLGYSSLGAIHWIAALSWGIRYVPDRARVPPVSNGLASGAKIFVSIRRDIAAGPTYQVLVGIEVEPSWLLPPYSRAKWVGE